MDVTGPIRSELMILTGLMIARMWCKKYSEHEVFPVLMLSLYGSRGCIVQAHMPPESGRLQVRYSEFFDFRELTQDWLDIFVRWFLSEPLAEPLSRSEVTHSGLRIDSENLKEAEVDEPPDHDSRIAESPRLNPPEHPDTPEHPGTSEHPGTPRPPLKTISTPLSNAPCDAEGLSLAQTVSPQ
ncbi:hypothetical protein EPUS_05187 [Endocarpon pusillum Z07020]|uniref:Uncharacterized protein n=1 Tax=Endocarpon pusillum (strain Z07020 / HMAS-L-300199) TaxID=1263415 RepID=U1GE56_ENDPU|nr:uncharacterized protein EPUS_05187 [Endocarpon pusillum Z07020]ERF70368.1 hypothetical protein EPUS_05187 [Endocarpon pusillum Z07020]